MTCSAFHPEIALLVGGELPADRRPAVERHLESCAACRHLADALRDDRRALRSLAAEPVPGAALDRIRDRLGAALAAETTAAARRTGVRHRRTRTVLALAAGLAAVAILGYALVPWLTGSATRSNPARQVDLGAPPTAERPGGDHGRHSPPSPASPSPPPSRSEPPPTDRRGSASGRAATTTVTPSRRPEPTAIGTGTGPANDAPVGEHPATSPPTSPDAHEVLASLAGSTDSTGSTDSADRTDQTDRADRHSPPRPTAVETPPGGAPARQAQISASTKEPLDAAGLPAPPALDAEQPPSITIRIVSDDPDIVFYWLVDEPKEVSDDAAV